MSFLLDRAADRVGRPQFWGRAVTRIVGLAVVIGGAAFLLAASLAPTVAVAVTAVTTVDQQMFDFEPMPDDLGEPQERSVVLARDGTILAVLHDVENRKLVPLADVPRHVIDAVLATEDASFFEHEGVDWRAIARASVGNARAGEVRSGASTITQQLVKLAVTKDRSETLERKLREAVYASALEQQLSKDQILGEYLNLAYFGHGIYGIGTAAEYYFDHPVSELTVREGALLAGMIRAPEINDPIDNPPAARGRRNIVIAQMVEHGFLDAEDGRRISKSKLGLNLARRQPKGRSFFVAYVTELLKSDPALGPDRSSRSAAILRGGLTIKTTLEPKLQRAAGKAIRSVLSDPDGPQSSVTAVDPRTGEILAIGVGPRSFGRGKGKTQVTPAVRRLGSPAGRQPGSAFKGFELVAALEHGISPKYTFQADARYTTSNKKCQDDGEDYNVGNYADASQGLLDMAAATAKSSNTYFTHLVDLTGPDKLVDAARRMGVGSDFTAAYCSYVLGTKDVYGLDMASGYGTLANKGMYCRPYAITQVVDRRGRTVLRNDGDCIRAVEPGVAAQATDLLRGPIENGTATTNGQIGRPAAGKTGTTDDYRDAWFVGYVPQLSASTWVGYPGATRPMSDPRCGTGRVTGGCLPTMIWSTFMKDAVKILDLRRVDFDEPPPLPTGRVPNVKGLRRAAAVRTIEAADFIPSVELVRHHADAGTVVAQAPRGSRRAELGTAVKLKVSDGLGTVPVMPTLTGLTRAEADALLREEGLLATAVTVPVPNTGDYGRVVAQTPAAGSRIGQNPSITVEIGRAPVGAERRTVGDPNTGSGGGSESDADSGADGSDDADRPGRRRGQGADRRP